MPDRKVGWRSAWVLAALLLASTLAGCGSLRPVGDRAQVGIASWYDPGRRRVGGVVYDSSDLTAAHRSLPFGTRVQVTNLANGRTVTVVINDRGPFVRGRIIDLSKPAARRLGIIRSGVARVRIGPPRRWWWPFPLA